MIFTGISDKNCLESDMNKNIFIHQDVKCDNTEKGLLDEYDSMFQGYKNFNCISRIFPVSATKIITRIDRWDFRMFIQNAYIKGADYKHQKFTYHINNINQTDIYLLFEELEDTYTFFNETQFPIILILPKTTLYKIMTRKISLKQNYQILFNQEILIKPMNIHIYLNDLKIIYSDHSIIDIFIPKPVLIFCPSEPSEKDVISSFHENATSIITRSIRLNKLEISFLIGKNGSRIESIRNSSAATIKIIPIANKLSSYELRNPKHIHQELSISGTSEELAKTIALIESYLVLFNTNPDLKF